MTSAKSFSGEGGNPILEMHDRMYLAVTRDLKVSLTPEQVEELNEIEKAASAKAEKARVAQVRDLERERLEPRRGTVAE